ncbi:Crp/Fnr family transcriptional regulator [Agriterribacter sp.]|uniref:Crp/Fnr family transcriptional regulator n=1 Tax=Agriterribacter sp. TaxID=2821509 RepID=UPI002C760DAD|nr:Crp/Fnr family transcriptional regulator [Agriterribacter sp.]HTN09261.1 Crp/Fnr family transcriptional regulator [Agriterribacter sp.]
MNALNALFSNPGLVEEITSKSRKKTLSSGDALILPGDVLFFVPIVLSGALRIVREDEEGREVFLYHLYPSQTCAMAVNCCQSTKKSMIKAIAEDETEVLMVPADLIDQLFKYPEWKAFINNTYSSRFAELIEVIDLIAFNSLDKKILNYLEKKKEALHTSSLYITHQQIAGELNTHREAVSRLLRTMEQKGIVKLGRNTIELL